MAKNMLRLLQPQIVKFANSYDLPKSLRNRYVINFNAVGIEWFQENFITLETEHGFLIQENKDWDRSKSKVEPFRFLLEDFGSDKFDVPRVYFKISEEYIEDDSLLFEFITKALSSPQTYGIGIPGKLVPGRDFFINETLYKYLTRTEDSSGNQIHPHIPVTSGIKVPNYLDVDGYIDTDQYEELSEAEQDYINLSYYAKKNKALGYNYSESEITSICRVFPQTILDMTNIDDETRSESDNSLYANVLQFYANGKTDCATQMMDKILGGNYSNPNTANGQYGNGTLGTCMTCNSGSSSSSTSISGQSNGSTCVDLYRQAMVEYLKKMLGDADFYDDWMTNPIGDSSFPNVPMIDALSDLLQAYGEWLNSKTPATSVNDICKCPQISGGSSKGNGGNSTADSIDTINDYLNLLCLVKEGKTSQNKNKIKVWGEAFAELLDSSCGA